MGRGLGIPHPLAYTRYQPTSKAERVARATRWRSSSCSSRGGKAGRRRGDSDEQAHCGYVARGVAVWRVAGVWLTPPPAGVAASWEDYVLQSTRFAYHTR
jgi:hypothetical protein